VKYNRFRSIKFHFRWSRPIYAKQSVFRFRNSNKKYLKIKNVAEEVVNRLLTDLESILSSALIAVVEVLRMNPDRYAIIYDSKYDNDDNVPNSSTTTTPILSSSFNSSTSTKPNQNCYYNKYHGGILEIAKGFLNILLTELVDRTMVAAVKEKMFLLWSVKPETTFASAKTEVFFI
jgi:hypothetical protein